jgi:ATP-dependent DNA ligase
MTASGSSPESMASASTCGVAAAPCSTTGFRASQRRWAPCPDGHSDFAALRTKEGGERASFVPFDLLVLEGDDLRDRPLEERREALARLVHGAAGVRFSEALSADGPLVFAHACKLGLEGIVSKRAGSRYRSGVSRNWLKVLNPEFERREGLA